MEEKYKKLEKIVKEVNYSENFNRNLKELKDDFVSLYETIGSFLYECYVIGSLPHEDQVKYGKFSPRAKTLVNAILFGMIGTSFEYGGAANILKKTGVDPSEDAFITTQISSMTHISHQNILRGYVFYNIVMNSVRIAYTLITGKGARSWSPMGVVFNAAFHSDAVYHSSWGVRLKYYEFKNGLKKVREEVNDLFL